MSIRQRQVRNRLLAGLDPDAYALLQPHLAYRSLEYGAPIERPDEPIAEVCFPEPGVVSVVAGAIGDARIEVGVVGPEGMTGLALLHGTDRSPHATFAQIPCRALCLPSDPFRRALDASRPLHTHLLRYAHAFHVQVAQTVLCSGHLTITERLARWLLMCHDRVDRDDLALTHEFLALMLGVRRPSVTTALQVLEGTGAVCSRRGVIGIRQRALLIEMTGGGYGIPEAEYARLFGG